MAGRGDWAATKYCPALPTPFRCRFFPFRFGFGFCVFLLFFVAVAALRPNIIDELSPRHFVDCCRARNFRFRLSERQPVTRDSCLHILHTHTHTRTLWGNYLHVCVCVRVARAIDSQSEREGRNKTDYIESKIQYLKLHTPTSQFCGWLSRAEIINKYIFAHTHTQSYSHTHTPTHTRRMFTCGVWDAHKND